MHTQIKLLRLVKLWNAFLVSSEHKDDPEITNLDPGIRLQNTVYMYDDAIYTL